MVYGFIYFGHYSFNVPYPTRSGLVRSTTTTHRNVRAYNTIQPSSAYSVFDDERWTPCGTKLVLPFSSPNAIDAFSVAFQAENADVVVDRRTPQNGWLCSFFVFVVFCVTITSFRKLKRFFMHTHTHTTNSLSWWLVSVFVVCAHDGVRVCLCEYVFAYATHIHDPYGMQ